MKEILKYIGLIVLIGVLIAIAQGFLCGCGSSRETPSVDGWVSADCIPPSVFRVTSLSLDNTPCAVVDPVYSFLVAANIPPDGLWHAPKLCDGDTLYPELMGYQGTVCNLILPISVACEGSKCGVLFPSVARTDDNCPAQEEWSCSWRLTFTPVE